MNLRGGTKGRLRKRLSRKGEEKEDRIAPEREEGACDGSGNGGDEHEEKSQPADEDSWTAEEYGTE